MTNQTTNPITEVEVKILKRQLTALEDRIQEVKTELYKEISKNIRFRTDVILGAMFVGTVLINVLIVRMIL